MCVCKHEDDDDGLLEPPASSFSFFRIYRRRCIFQPSFPLYKRVTLRVQEYNFTCTFYHYGAIPYWL